jgi:hypothetical protein
MYGNALKKFEPCEDADNEDLKAFREELKAEAVSAKTRQKMALLIDPWVFGSAW